MEKTFEHDGKIFREIETLEEAERFRSFVMKCYDGNGTTYEEIIKITVFDNGSIKLNKRSTNFLLTQCKINDEPVGIYVGLVGIKLPSVNEHTIQDLYAYELFGMSETEAKIRKYIFEKRWNDKSKWDGNSEHWYIYYIPTEKMWSFALCTIGKIVQIFVDNKEHAVILCNELNQSGIKL